MLKEYLQTIDQFDLKDKKVFIRADLNVPILNGVVQNSYRILNALPTIRYALDQKAKVILASHLGRPSGVEPELSLSPVAEFLSQELDVDVFFIEELISDVPTLLSPSLRQNQLLMLENLRFYKGESNNDKELAQELAKDIDIYINDAFGVCHREHMSLSALPCCVKTKGIGFLIQKEMEWLDRIKTNPSHPFTAVLGGAKIKDKIETILSLMDTADELVIGGAMAYVFLKAQGFQMGNTQVDNESISIAKDLINRMKGRDKKLHLPIDHLTVSEIQKTNYIKVTSGANVPDTLKAVDIGPKTIEYFKKIFHQSKTIFWNGPMGIFEIPAYAKGTIEIAKAIGQQKQALRIVGGGDSARAVLQSQLEKEFDHVSTGGGASLFYIQNKTLSGLRSAYTIERTESTQV